MKLLCNYGGRPNEGDGTDSNIICPNLRNLCVNNAVPDLTKFPKLKTLFVKNVMYSWIAKSSSLIALIVQHSVTPALVICEKLRSLSITNTSIQILDYFDACKGLRSLRIESVYNDNKCTNFWEKHLGIRRLAFCNTNSFFDELLDKILFICVNVTHLEITKCKYFVKLNCLNRCKKLITLDLTGCTNLTHLPNLVDSCGDLLCVDVRDCNSLVDVSGIMGCKKLEVVRVTNAMNLMRQIGRKK